MIKKLHIKLSLTLMLAALLVTIPSSAQERLYIEEWSFTPGGEVDYFTIGLENGAHKDYTAFQFDLVLPAGLEIAYYESNEGLKPDIGKAESGAVYQRRNDHNVACELHNGFIRVICMSLTNMTFGKTSGNLIDVYVTPTPYLKPGDIEIKLANVKFAKVTEEYGYRADELILTGLTAESTSTLPVKVSSSNKYSTAVFPFDIDAIPTGLEVYSCHTTSGDNLVLTKQSRANAYTPYILYAANGYSGTLSGSVDASKYSENVSDGYLSGTLFPCEIGGGEGHYVMQNKGDGPMFYKVTDTTFSIPAGKCWLTLPAALQGSTSFRIDGTTGVDEVSSEVKGENGKVNAIYDLQGRKVGTPNKGLYIVGGKKIMVK